jgi:molybdopterin-guanine dinucleotide biosynthesis protein A
MNPTSAHDKICPNDVTGLLLAGGLGRRMGGADKGLVALNTLDGRPMASWVLDRLRPQVGAVIINANRHLDEWQVYGDRVVSDEFGGFSGPLAGVHAGLLACSTSWLVSAPCDSPFLPLDLVSRLAEGIRHSGADLAVVRTDGQLQPVFALMRREVLASLEQFLQGGGRKIDRWFDALKTTVVDYDDSAAFANINTPEELAVARRP